MALGIKIAWGEGALQEKGKESEQINLGQILQLLCTGSQAFVQTHP